MFLSTRCIRSHSTALPTTRLHTQTHTHAHGKIVKYIIYVETGQICVEHAAATVLTAPMIVCWLTGTQHVCVHVYVYVYVHRPERQQQQVLSNTSWPRGVSERTGCWWLVVIQFHAALSDEPPSCVARIVRLCRRLSIVSVSGSPYFPHLFRSAEANQEDNKYKYTHTQIFEAACPMYSYSCSVRVCMWFGEPSDWMCMK